MLRSICFSLFLVVAMLPASLGLFDKEENQNNKVQSIQSAPIPDNNNIIVINKHNPQQARRKLFDFWTFLFALNANAPCPPIGPLHEKCKNSRSESDSSSTSDSSGESSSYSENLSNSGESVPSSGNKDGLGKFSWLMLVAASVAAMFAIGAIIAGQRKQEEPHPLKGSVARRKGLFQSFTDCALCDAVPGGSDAAERHFEMTASRDDYDRCSV